MKLEPLHEHVEVGAEFARGGFMRVLTGQLRAGGDAVVVKLPLRPPGEEKARLVREARLVAQVDHPSLARLRGVFAHPEGELALVYDRVMGPSLREAMEARAIDLVAARAVLAQVAGGLDALHDAGLVCRDIKPANVVLREGAPCVIVDFGLVRGGDQPTLTAEGIVMGTPAYMAPEGFLGHRLEAPADVYALGVMAYELLVGRLPFAGDLPALARLHRDAAPPRIPAGLGLPGPALDAVFARALAKDPAARPARAGELVAALEAALAAPQEAPNLDATIVEVARQAVAPSAEGHTTRKRGGSARSPAAGLVGLLVLVAVAGAWWRRPAPPDAPPDAPGVASTPASVTEPPALPPLDPDAIRDELAALAVDPDPYRWAEQVRGLESVARFRRWLGSRPAGEVAPAEARQRARRAGEAFRVVGLASPFEPFLEVEPAGDAAGPSPAIPGKMNELQEWSRMFPGAHGGWLGAALAAFVEAADQEDRDTRELRENPTGPYREGIVLPQAKVIWGVFHRISPESFFSQASMSAPNRVLLRGWLAPGEGALLRGLVAAARSLEVEPDRAVATTLLVDRAMKDLVPYLFGRLHACRPEELTGRVLQPDSIGHLALAATLQEHAARVERETSATDPEHFREEVRLRLEILSREGPEVELPAARIFEASAQRVRSVLGKARGTAAMQSVERMVAAALPILRAERRLVIEEALGQGR